MYVIDKYVSNADCLKGHTSVNCHIINMMMIIITTKYKMTILGRVTKPTKKNKLKKRKSNNN